MKEFMTIFSNSECVHFKGLTSWGWPDYCKNIHAMTSLNKLMFYFN